MTAAGLLACAQSQQFNPLWIEVGAFVGLIGLGAGGVRSHLVVQGYHLQSAGGLERHQGRKEGRAGAGAANPAPAEPTANLTLIESAERATGQPV
jgi:hypothetical protein